MGPVRYIAQPEKAPHRSHARQGERRGGIREVDSGHAGGCPTAGRRQHGRRREGRILGLTLLGASATSVTSSTSAPHPGPGLRRTTSTSCSGSSSPTTQRARRSGGRPCRRPRRCSRSSRSLPFRGSARGDHCCRPSQLRPAEAELADPAGLLVALCRSPRLKSPREKSPAQFGCSEGP
jgi:hypothetical protein